MFRAFKLYWVLYVISLSIFFMNRANTSVWFFFEWFNSVLNEVMFMLQIENDFFWIIVETDCLSILEIFDWEIKVDEVDCNQLECFELREIEKFEMRVFNWFEKMMTSIHIFSNISFLFIQDFSNMTSWWSMSTINIEIVNFLWLSIMRFDRILWVIVFLNIFSSYSFINFFFVSDINWIFSSLHTLLTRLICMII